MLNKSLRATKIVKQVRFNRAWRKLGAKHCSNNGRNFGDKLLFSRQIGNYGENLISVFQEFFASIETIFILGERTSTRL